MAKQRISKEKRALALASMFEGVGINGTCRLVGIDKESLLRVLVETAEACEDWHNRHFRGLTVARLEIDEQWGFVHTHKERMTREEKVDHPDRGDCWLWGAVCAESKAFISWRTGKRSYRAADAFSRDLADRITGEVQITSDQLKAYRMTIPRAFGRRAHYAQERKVFRSGWTPDSQYLQQRVDPLKSVRRRRISMNPDMKLATVCHIERFFLSTRQGIKRLGRKTLGYSKKWRNHAAANSVFAFMYNLVRRHEALGGLTPAQKLSVTEKRWIASDVVEMTDTYFKMKEARAFEEAFQSKFNVQPTARRTWEPRKPKTPWYLDPDSGGKDCPQHLRKPDVDYDA
jgi:IS1 family transposase